MRADARHNHDLILRVARDLFVERGPDAPMDEVARRGGVGIGTVYRRFTDRSGLMNAVVLAALTSTADAAEQARHDHTDPMAALAAYVHAVLDLRTPAVISILLDAINLEEPQIRSARDRSSTIAQQLVDSAHESGALRTDVTSGDIGVMLVRLARPLPGLMTPAIQGALAHRHADLFLAGLRTKGLKGSLSGPALDLADLRTNDANDVAANEPA
jgi:AcrR family transcriptional regulator